MDHIAKITAQLPEHGLDAMLVTSAPGERYAVGFEGEGWVLVSRDGARYSTDGRYIEAARQQVTGAEIVLTERGQSHLALAREEIRRRGLKRVGFESGRVSADELGRWKASPVSWWRLRACWTGCGPPRTRRSWPGCARPSASPTRRFGRS